MKEYKEVLIKLKKYKYVSFDIFDTLIFRTLKTPEDVFDLVQYRYNLVNKKQIAGFKKKRIAAEQEARKESNWTEVTINDIYSKLNFETQIKQGLMNLEKEVEVEICLPNPIMVKLLNECRERGQRIIIITDMYLDRDTICNILKKIQVEYDELFISCEHKATKNSGKLYQIVLKQLKIQPSELVHIGDNPINDIQKACENGITSIERLINAPKKLLYCENKTFSVLQEQFKNTISLCINDCREDTPEYHIGIEIVGPVIYDFCLWIRDCKERLSLTKLYFLAREGYFIYKCYQKMFPDDAIEYISLNRNLLRAPLMDLDDISGYLVNNIPDKNEYTIRELLTYLSLNRLLDLAGMKDIDDTLMDSVITRQELKNGNIEPFLKKFVPVLTKYKMEQERLLLEYLTAHKLIEGKNGLVNNSINGTGQSLLEKFLTKYGINVDIIGLQFVKSEKCVERLENRCKAWLSEKIKTKKYEYDFERMSLVFEHLLFEPTGTSLYFYRGEDGKVSVYNEPQRKEINNNQVINLIQREALKCIDYLIAAHVVESDDWSIRNYIKFINYPDQKSAMLLCDLYDDDADGDYKIADDKISYSISIILGKDISDSIKWPEGFLKAKGRNNFILALYHARIWIRRVKKTLR